MKEKIHYDENLPTINRYSFLGVPLTSVPHYDKWHAQFTFQEKDSFAK